MSVEWSLKCDRVGCTAAVVVRARTDNAARCKAVETGRLHGWQIGMFGEHSLDFCPMHKEVA